jgi:hypothetical protein
MTLPEPFPLDYKVEEGTDETGIDAFVFEPTTSTFILEISLRAFHGFLRSTFIFELQALTSPTILPLPYPQKIIKRFIGVNNNINRIMFLDHESWICSIDPADVSGPLQRYTRHFFVPDEYIPVDGEVLPLQIAGGDFAFCFFNKVVVVKNGSGFHTMREIV